MTDDLIMQNILEQGKKYQELWNRETDSPNMSETLVRERDRFFTLMLDTERQHPELSERIQYLLSFSPYQKHLKAEANLHSTNIASWGHMERLSTRMRDVSN